MPNDSPDATVLDQLVSYISQEFASGGQTIGPEDDLLASGRIDSMGIMRLVAYLESAFEISVPPEDLTIENFQNATTIARYIDAARSDVQQA